MAKSSDMKAIQFSKPVSPYLAGEVAWFDTDRAEAYVTQGFARFRSDLKFMDSRPKRTEPQADTQSSQA